MRTTFQAKNRGDSTAGEQQAIKRRKEYLESLKRREKEELKANERTMELRRLRLQKAETAK